MNNEQRLQLISEMISISRNNFQKSSFYFLLWGSVICLANLAHFAMLEFSTYPHPYIVWLVSIPAVIITVIYSIKQDRSASVKNHLDEIIGIIWAMYTIAIFIIITFGVKINYQINPVILCMTAIPTISTARILKFKPLIWGGITFFLASAASFYIQNTNYQFLIAALAIATGYLIPGYLLKIKENKNGV